MPTAVTSHARRIDNDAVGREDIVEAVLGDEQKKCGRGAHDGVGAQASALALDFPFEADERGQDKGRAEFEELEGTLPGLFGVEHD